MFRPAALAALTAALVPAAASAERITVFAAASLGTALREVEARFEAATGHDLVVSLAGSSALARQIAAGAPADVFVSASPDWMDALEAEGLIAEGTRFDLIGNRLVLAAHGTETAPVEIGPGLDLAALLGEGRLAMALVDAVPAGVYGKAALVHFGLWEEVAPRVAQTDNVRAALALVATGEAPFGIVYATDAAAEAGVRVAATFPEESHPPIVYPAAAVAGSETATAFLDWLRGAEARSVFEAHGFTGPDATGAGIAVPGVAVRE
jgi:molybdate transport system substrate-binding protein